MIETSKIVDFNYQGNTTISVLLLRHIYKGCAKKVVGLELVKSYVKQNLLMVETSKIVDQLSR
jgi:hypothetical protein